MIQSKQKKICLLISILLSFFLFFGCNTHPESSDLKGQEQFKFVEATIESVHEALMGGSITCVEVVKGYIARIKAYDPDTTEVALSSVVTINPYALSEARKKDQNYSTETFVEKPLYCIPILLKDNINTIQMPTTGGALIFKNNQPTYSAFVVQGLLEAGALIFGKTNMDEFAFNFLGKSSIGGLTVNPYDLRKGVGGSSSGTAAAIAASFAIAGLGTDTGGSIRVPSSLTGLIGIRPSTRLISQHGIMPLSPWQDVVGPMCRTVRDCALVLDAIVGFDPHKQSNQRVSFKINSRLINNKVEYKKITGVPESYTKFLDINGLRNARIGVVRALFGTDSVAINIVNPVINKALDQMRKAGAVVEKVIIPDLDDILHDYESMSTYQFKSSLERYLNTWPVLKDHHILSYEALVESGGYLSSRTKTIKCRGTIDLDHLSDKQRKVYRKNTIERPKFVRKRLLEALNNPEGKPYDVLIYPAVTGIAPALGESPETGSNNRLSPYSGFPALVMPVGMAINLHPEMPIGVEMLAREFHEGTLIKIAYSFQQLFQPWEPPTTTPPLKEETVEKVLF